MELPYLLIFLAMTSVRPDSTAVYVLNEHLQLVTSTSLRWIEAQNGQRPLHAVVGGSNGSESLFVCRAPGGGREVSRPGQLGEQGCLTVIPDGMGPKFVQVYQVLVNEEGSARLEWVDWQQFQALPVGTVNTANDIYVAREFTNEIRHNSIGGLHLAEQYGLILVPPGGRRLTSGQLLMEHQPIKYELLSFKPDRLRQVHSQEVKLKEPFFRGQQNYTFDNELYFGRGQNIATGSLVTLHWGNGTKVNFHWGIARSLPRKWKHRWNLGGQAAQSVVQATRVEKQWDYFATVSAHYRDGAILMRPIKGVFRQVTYEHLKAVNNEKISPMLPAAETPTISPVFAPSLEPPSFVKEPTFNKAPTPLIALLPFIVNLGMLIICW